MGSPLYICHLSYTDQLEDYIGRYKRRPHDIKHWPYGPYWPGHFEGLVLITPRHLWACTQEHEPLVSGGFGRQLLANSSTIDSQVTQHHGKWRGVQVVYDSDRSPRDFSPLPVPEGCCPTLMFESRFECGNLRQARRVGQFEYELVLKSDLYTSRHTQWYYFRVTNAESGTTYKIRIINLLKRDSLYNNGMRPLIYSEQDAKEKQRGWVRAGHHISYTRNTTSHNCQLLEKGVAYHTLEWQMEFNNTGDTYYLAHCYPYSFTDLKEDLELLLNSEDRSKVTRREVMCETRAGNSCFLLTVTNFDCQDEKRAVVVTARVHPGESQASWMMRGLLDFITGPDPAARFSVKVVVQFPAYLWKKNLRNKFVFKVVPMVNPDGVIVGNYRCSLAARDLNRNYRHPRQESFPTIWYIKNMVYDLAKKHEIALYCDLHGHSRKPNVFMYGNNTSADGESSAHNMARAFLSERLFPWLMSVKSPDKFHFKSCKFQIRRCKESTGRVVMWRQMRVFNSFTMEASFSGTMMDRENCRHFNIHDFMDMGKVLAQTVLEYQTVKDDPTRHTQSVVGLTRMITEQILICKGLLRPGASLPGTLNQGNNKTGGVISQKSNKNWNNTLISNSHRGQTSSGVKDRPWSTKATSNDTSSVHSCEDLEQLMQKLASGSTLEDCVELLAQLDVQNTLQESDSSDSDSETEPEVIHAEPTKHRKKRRKSKRQRDKDIKKMIALTETKKKLEEVRAKSTPNTLPGIGHTKALPSINSTCRPEGSNSVSAYTDNSILWQSKQASTEKHRSGRSISGFVSKYEGRHNGGLPCFTEERSIERAEKRIASQGRTNQDRTKDNDFCRSDEVEHVADTHADLNHRLLMLNSASFNLNIRTGYTHADSLKDMYSGTLLPLNDVNTYRKSALSAQGYHHSNSHHGTSSTKWTDNADDINNNSSIFLQVPLPARRNPYQHLDHALDRSVSELEFVGHSYLTSNPTGLLTTIPVTSPTAATSSTTTNPYLSTPANRFPRGEMPNFCSTGQNINLSIIANSSPMTTSTAEKPPSISTSLLSSTPSTNTPQDLCDKYKTIRGEIKVEPVGMLGPLKNRHRNDMDFVISDALTIVNKNVCGSSAKEDINGAQGRDRHDRHSSRKINTQDKPESVGQLVNHLSHNLSGVVSPRPRSHRQAAHRTGYLYSTATASHKTTTTPSLMTTSLVPNNRSIGTDNLASKKLGRVRSGSKIDSVAPGTDQ